MLNSNKVINIAEVKSENENLYVSSLERSFLSSLLIRNELVNFIPEYLQLKHFGNRNLGEIFKAIKTVVGKGVEANPDTVNRALPSDVSEQFGGSSSITELIEEIIISDRNTVIHYAETIYDHHKKRELYQLLAESLTSLTASKNNSDQLVESHEKKLFKFTQSYRKQSGDSSFKDLGRKVIDQLSEAYNLNKEGKTVGLLTAFGEIDEHLGGLQSSQLYILAGKTSMGKTALATNIAFNVAQSGKSVLFCSLEMSGEEIATRILSNLSKVNSKDIKKGTVDDVDFGKVDTAYRENSDIKLEVKNIPDVAGILSLARRKKQHEGLELIVVDYLQLLDEQDKNNNRTQEITKISRGLKLVAVELGVPIIALSQLSRKGEDRRPILSDLRESGSIEQDADVVMFVHREEYYLERENIDEGNLGYLEWKKKLEEAKGKAELIIAKQRHGELRTINLKFDGQFTKFSDL